MSQKSETPPAAGTANGAKSKACELHMNNTPNPAPEPILDRIRRAHLAQLCGVTDHRASLIAAVYFAGGQS